MLTLIGGVFTGGGRDVPPNHYLPERLVIPLFVARAGVGNVDRDPFVLAQDDQGTLDRRVKGALFVNALYTKDSLIGHSTVLNVKLVDKSLLLDGNWNPYIGRAPFDQGTWWQAGADAAVRAPLGALDFAGETAFDFGKYSNSYGSVQMWGLRAQGGVTYRSFALAIRYAYLVPDSHFAYMGVPLTGSQPIQELTPSATWFIKGQRLKLLADLPVIIHDPIFTEANVGSYAATDLPDQATVLAGGWACRRGETPSRGKPSSRPGWLCTEHSSKDGAGKSGASAARYRRSALATLDVRTAFSSEKPAHHRQQLIHAGLFHSGQTAWRARGVTGQDPHRDVRQGRHLAHRPIELVAAHDGHRHVEHDRTGSLEPGQ